MQIRKASKKDTKTLLDLLKQLRPLPFSKAQQNYMKTIHDYVSCKDKQILLAIDKSKIIGLASVVFLPRLNQKLELWIPELVVDKNYRKKGIGKSLIQSCINMARKKGCSRIRLESGNKRKGSHKFYKKLGFVQYALCFKKVL